MPPRVAKASSKEGAAQAAPPVPDFEELEMIMAEDKGNIYPAQVIKKVESDGHGPATAQYFIHYKGWARKYDTWVQPNQICKKGDVEAERRLQQFSEAKTPKVKGGASSKRDAATEGGDASSEHAIKRKSNSELEQEERELKRNRLLLSSSDLLQEDDADMAVAQRMDIPLPLKRHLVDEWSLIAQQDPRRLLKLPRKASVEVLLGDFLESCEEGAKMSEEQLASYRDFFQGLMLYFNRALPTILLYRYEREQYTAAMSVLSELTPSGVYGAEHLLRLFVRLPKLLSGIFDAQNEVSQVWTKTGAFLKWVDFALLPAPPSRRRFISHTLFSTLLSPPHPSSTQPRFLQKNMAKYIAIEDYVPEAEAMVIEVPAGPKTRNAAERRK